VVSVTVPTMNSPFAAVLPPTPEIETISLVCRLWFVVVVTTIGDTALPVVVETDFDVGRLLKASAARPVVCLAMALPQFAQRIVAVYCV
jgi:hypothetical protein